MQYVVQSQGLRKTFGDHVAVDSISFAVRRGECFGLLGPNGAGKTTTIRMIYGFSPVTEGRLEVLGLDVCTDLTSIKYRLGVCQQDESLDPDLSLIENLEVYATYFDIPRKKAREKIEQLLAFIGLENRRDAKIDELSGGMKKRVVIARALINDPDLLILDEPTTGLDPQSRHQVWEKLEDLKAGGLSVLLTTHYMDEAARLCDRLVIIDHGRILVEGAPAELVARHVGKHVIEVSEPSDALRRFVQSKGLSYEDTGHRLVVYTGASDDLYQHISANFCTTGCVLRMATLEDVFLKLTGKGLRD